MTTSTIRSLKIAFHVSRDSLSGTYFRYHNLAMALQQRGHQVTVYTQGVPATKPHVEYREGIPFHVIPGFPGNSYFDYAVNPGNLMWRLVQGSADADVHHLFQAFPNSALTWRRERGRSADANCIFAWDWDDLWCGGLFPAAPNHWWRRWQYRMLERFEMGLPAEADVVTTCSQFLANLAQQRGASVARVVHNGFWPEASGKGRAELRQKFHLRPESFYLGFIGWTPTEVDWCLEALEQMPDIVRLACCGYDIRQNLGAFPELANRVDFVGTLASPEARELMRALDVGLLPLADSEFNRSRFPIKFAEYLAAGCPTICGQVGEIGSLGAGLRGAILLPPEKDAWVRSCVAVVRDIQRNPEKYTPDRARLTELLAWPGVAERLEEIYLHALARHPHEEPQLTSAVAV